MNYGIYTQDAQQEAFAFLVSQTAYIEPTVYRVQYPDIMYPTLVPIDTSANEWARSVTFFSLDRLGIAKWLGGYARDIPVADVHRQKFEHTIEMAGIGYRYSLEELGQAMLAPGINLSAERAMAARRGSEEFLERALLSGDTVKGWAGLFNDPNISVITVPATGTGGATSWDQKTPAQILTDLNAIITGSWSATLTIEMADTILLPLMAMSYLVTTQLPNTQMNLLTWVMQNNIYKHQTGRDLLIRAIIGLGAAGGVPSGSAGTGRMVAYRRDPSIVKAHVPMPHRFLPVWQTGPMVFDVPGIFRLGGIEIRRPSAFRYADGITGVGMSQ